MSYKKSRSPVPNQQEAGIFIHDNSMLAEHAFYCFIIHLVTIRLQKITFLFPLSDIFYTDFSLLLCYSQRK